MLLDKARTVSERFAVMQKDDAAGSQEKQDLPCDPFPVARQGLTAEPLPSLNGQGRAQEGACEMPETMRSI